MRVLFIGLGGTRVAWYRCVLPAMFWPEKMQDWASMAGAPPHLQVVSSWVNSSTEMPNMFDYDVVVLQQVRGHKWLESIKKLQSNGQKVLYETDDYVHGVKDVEDHEFKRAYQEIDLKSMRLCMRASDGMIVSTKHLGELYQNMARKIYVCENGLDLGRYRLTKPDRGEINGEKSVTVLWQGATGHHSSISTWLRPIKRLMNEIPHLAFVSVGKQYADALGFPDRTISIPFASLETYPAAMMAGDVSIAPAGKSEWHKSKSQLRAMESMALGIPVVADPFYSESIEPYGAGFVAETPGEAEDFIRELVLDEELREKTSLAAHHAAHSNFGMQHKVGQWVDAVTDVLQSPSVR